MHIFVTIVASLISTLICTFIFAVCAIPFLLVAKSINGFLKFRSAKRWHEIDPSANNLAVLKKRKTSCIVSTIIMTVVVAAYIVCIVYGFQIVLYVINITMMISFFTIPCYSMAAALFSFIKYFKFNKKYKSNSEVDHLEKLKGRKTVALITFIAALFFSAFSLIIIHTFGSEISFM